MVPTVEILAEPVSQNPLLEEVIEDPLDTRVLGGTATGSAAPAMSVEEWEQGRAKSKR